MLKKLGVVTALLIIFISIFTSNVNPVFKRYADNYEVYLGQASSLADIKVVEDKEYVWLRGVKGESVTLKAEQFDLDKLLKEFDASVIFTETTSDSQIIYAYSPKIKYQKKIKGQTINLHVAMAKERVVVGSPLIFGSF